MRIMESITSGQALFVSAITGGPSVIWATLVTEDFTPVATGAAVGFAAFLLTVWRSSNDSRLSAVLARLDKAEKEADDYRAESTAAKAQNAKLTVDLAYANAKIEKATSDGMTTEHA